MNLQESMLLWIPPNLESQEEWDVRAKEVTQANGAVLDFCDRVITLDEMLQTVEFYGADVDLYLYDLAETVRILGA
jgi:hypothetical protein